MYTVFSMEFISCINPTRDFFFKYRECFYVLFAILGFVYSVIVPNYHIKKIISKLHKNSDSGFNTSSTSEYLGFVERALFTLVFFIQKFELIVAWFVIKTAINVIYDYKSAGPESIRRSYNIFLIGTLINVFYGFVGSKIITWGSLIVSGQPILLLKFFIIPIVLFILTCIMCCRIKEKT